MSSSHEKPRVVAEKIVYDGFARMTKYTVQAPWQGRVLTLVREVHFHGHVAAILPVDPVRRVGILIRQFRLTPFLDGGDGWLWEAPAGLLEGDAPDHCAKKEAREEAGIAIETLESLGELLSSPGIIRESVFVFWGTYSGPPPAATGGLEHEGEMIEVHELPMAEIARMAEDGDILDAKSALAVFRLKARRPDLFAG
jgi:nudix-type nucleoside diphosphatase (YffH/AdpP family)